MPNKLPGKLQAATWRGNCSQSNAPPPPRRWPAGRPAPISRSGALPRSGGVTAQREPTVIRGTLSYSACFQAVTVKCCAWKETRSGLRCAAAGRLSDACAAERRDWSDKHAVCSVRRGTVRAEERRRRAQWNSLGRFYLQGLFGENRAKIMRNHEYWILVTVTLLWRIDSLTSLTLVSVSSCIHISTT